MSFDTAKYFDLNGKAAIVTGGATGLGLAITKCLAGAGAKVAVIGSSPYEKAEPALALLGDDVRYYRHDLTKTDETPDVISRIADDFGRLDILVSNAGNHCKKSLEEMTVEDYESVLKLHLSGGFAAAKAAVPYMKQTGGGRILFMASMTSYIGQPYVAGYASAKAGILGLVHTLTAELAPYNITVNVIAPGWIDTPMFHKATDNDPPRLAKILGRIPAGRVGDPMDIGLCAAFLCSDAASYISGSCIPVDGGALIGF